jgi:bis(5'-nucleosyl)-tetraphosphatase (symmetrical)
MALYAIGDVQGCDHELGELLKLIRFSADRDQLWFVGDLVNRGPKSLAVLRRVKALGDAAVSVLGNHDLHLIALAATKRRKPKRGDTLDEVLDAPDRGRLIEWLRSRPMLHEDARLGLALLHAGLPPQWTLATARTCARELERVLRTAPEEWLNDMYGDEPDLWDESLTGIRRLRFITNCFARLRFVDAKGRLALDEKQAPQVGGAKTLTPWFARTDAKWLGTRIVFGHWSTLGFFRNDAVIGIDTGCVWGDRLTAVRLDAPDAPPIQVACAGYRAAGND